MSARDEAARVRLNARIDDLEGDDLRVLDVLVAELPFDRLRMKLEGATRDDAEPADARNKFIPTTREHVALGALLRALRALRVSLGIVGGAPAGVDAHLRAARAPGLVKAGQS